MEISGSRSKLRLRSLILEERALDVVTGFVINAVVLFGPAIALRLWIQWASRAPQLVAVAIAGVGFMAMFFIMTQLLAVIGIEPWSVAEVALAMLGGFGLLPGGNKLRPLSKKNRQSRVV